MLLAFAREFIQASVIDLPAFKQWFVGSKIVDESGKPKVAYHGTSKDMFFNKFNVPKNGAWFSFDPKDASTYAEENDSKKYVLGPSGKIIEKHTTSRVIPVYIKALNPYYVHDWNVEFGPVNNYKRAQAILFDKLRSQGYDSVIGVGGVVVLSSPTQIKSAISNTTFDPKNPDFIK